MLRRPRVAPAAATTCDPCPPGHFGDEPGSGVCRPCPIGTYSEHPAAASVASCLKCPTGTVTAGQGSQHVSTCIPTPGFVVLAPQLSATAEVVPCPAGFNCSIGVVGVHNLPLLEGWWRATNSTLNARECPTAAACVGGSLRDAGWWPTNRNLDNQDSGEPYGPVSSTVCRPGHYGAMCGFCRPGWQRSFGLCKRCPDDAVQRFWLTTLFMLGVCLVLLAIAYCIYRKCKSELVQALGLHHLDPRRMKGLGKERLAQIQAQERQAEKHTQELAHFRAAGTAVMAMTTMSHVPAFVDAEDDLVGTAQSELHG